MDHNQKIGLGSVQFGLNYGVSNVDGQTPELEVFQILELAKRYNISVIDTASAYGVAEIVLGRNDLSSFNVISKFLPSSEKGSIKSQLELSLDRLNLASIYGYIAHRPDILLKNIDEWHDLIELQQELKVRKIGFSFNSPDELRSLLSRGIIPDLVQVPFNYFDNRFKPILIELRKYDCEIHSRSVFLQGLFFVQPDKLNGYFSAFREPINELQLCYGSSLSQALLQYVLNQDFIDYVIMGVENKAQLLGNLAGIDKPINLPNYRGVLPDDILMPSNWPK